jgi:hypothetical protein
MRLGQVGVANVPACPGFCSSTVSVLSFQVDADCANAAAVLLAQLLEASDCVVEGSMQLGTSPHARGSFVGFVALTFKVCWPCRTRMFGLLSGSLCPDGHVLTPPIRNRTAPALHPLASAPAAAASQTSWPTAACTALARRLCTWRARGCAPRLVAFHTTCCWLRRRPPRSRDQRGAVWASKAGLQQVRWHALAGV